MKKAIDFGIIGGGIGGCMSAVLLSKKLTTILFEKESYLGGCSSTFKRSGCFFNTGATTFAGFNNQVLRNFFRKHQIDFKKKRLDFALCVKIKDKTVYRYEDFDKFIDSINSAFYHKKNLEFWKLIFEINRDFYLIDDYFYDSANFINNIKSIYSFKTIFFKFYKYLFVTAKEFISKFFDNNIDSDYLNFLDNQCLIVAQAKTDEINFLTSALALGYHFQQNYYIYGGMGAIFDEMRKQILITKTNTFVQKIKKIEDFFIIHTKDSSYEVKNIILNSTIFDSIELFEDKQTVNYFKKYQKLNSDIGAFMLYLELKQHLNLEHHYQIITNDTLPFTISNSIFVSFGDKLDDKLKNSVTISVHIKVSDWEEEYEYKKIILSNYILTVLHEKLNISNDMIKNSFCATPKTFKKFINRATVGGIPVTKDNLFYNIPSNITPIKGLYLVGDTTFASQGWLGVAMGVRNLEKRLS
ncbi:MAG: NAD(P)-binding protein [Campylobacterales bacterium]|nr:NAD(P)-binding protein [Campylobacterales bacterium]